MAGKRNITGWKNEIPPERLDENKNYILDAAEQEKILKAWNEEGLADLKKIIYYVWEIEELDGRSKQGQALKKFLISRNYSPVAAQTYIRKTDITELTDQDKDFIRNHAAELKPLEIAKARFGDNVTIGDVEYRLVHKFYESLPPEFWTSRYAENTKDYTPPKQFNQALARLRNFRIVDWTEDKMSVFDKECVKKLIEFANIPRFESDMSSIKDQKERNMVEAEFFRHIYNKPDLNSEDLSMYIGAAFATLDIKRLREEEGKARELIENSVDEDTGKPKFNQALIEYASGIRTEIGTRQSKLEQTFKKLSGDRAERLKNQGNQNITIAAMVDLWKDKTKRDKMIMLAKKREEKLLEEIAELKSMEALKFELWGANIGELIH